MPFLAPGDLLVASISSRRTPAPAPIPLIIQFQEVPLVQHFEFRDRRYQKLALSLASDEDRDSMIFQAQTEALPDPFLGAALPSEVSFAQPQPQR
jgi:hypothetical protein